MLWLEAWFIACITQLCLIDLNVLATSCKVLTHWKRLWCWEGLGAGGEGDDRGWDGWMASLTQWTWVWVNSGSWWWIGRPGVLRFMGSQRVGHDSVTELNWKLKIMIQVMWAAACIKYFNLKTGLIHTLCWLSLTTDSVNICWVTLIPFLGKWVTLLYGY